jgi:hypothetical protein
MQFSEHERAQHFADKALVEGISADEQRWLDEHTKNCAECAEHVQLSAKIVRGFNAFSFELDPGINARMQDAVAKRARVPDVVPRKISPFPARRAVIACATIAAAVLLAVAVTKYDFSRKTPIEARHQPTQSPQPTSMSNPPAVTSSSTIPTQTAPAVARNKPHRAPKPLIAEAEFIRLDDGPPVIDGTIVRINMPDTFAMHPRHGRKSKTVPAEVLVDEAGLVRAIRFLDEDSR